MVGEAGPTGMIQRSILRAVRFYRAGISPLRPPSCRFVPTCSAYAEEAVSRHGALRGSLMALRRILRCHPFGGQGYDPVPPAPASPGRRPASPVSRNSPP